MAFRTLFLPGRGRTAARSGKSLDLRMRCPGISRPHGDVCPAYGVL